MSQKQQRPISPHLSIYRPQITSVLSILHRISGVALFLVLNILVWWFILTVFSGFSPKLLYFFDNKIIKFFLYISTLGIFYHLCSGIRHLLFDMGLSFSIRSINVSGIIMVIIFLLISIIFWFWVV